MLPRVSNKFYCVYKYTLRKHNNMPIYIASCRFRPIFLTFNKRNLYYVPIWFLEMSLSTDRYTNVGMNVNEETETLMAVFPVEYLQVCLSFTALHDLFTDSTSRYPLVL